jgi:hypothetical protein
VRNRSTGGWGWGGRESRARPSYPVSIRYTQYGVGIQVNSKCGSLVKCESPDPWDIRLIPYKGFLK